MRIDLHTHSNYSDGELSIPELIEEAISRNIDILAITDHDFFDENVFSQALICAGTRIKLVKGIELSTRYSTSSGIMEIHLLAIDFKKSELICDLIKKSCSNGANEKYINDIANELSMFGICMPEYASLKENYPTAKMIGRSHIARWLVENGYNRSIDESFEQFLGKGCVAYKDWLNYCNYPDFELAVNTVLEAGGIPILAHGLSYGLSISIIDKLVDKFQEVLNGKVGAIEVNYKKYDIQKKLLLNRLANKYNLCQSSGSDYHCSDDEMMDEETNVEESRLYKLLIERE